MSADSEQTAASCPPEQTLVDLLHGRLDKEENAVLASHITNCTQCQSRIESIAGSSDFCATDPELALPESTPNVEALIETIATRGPRHGEVNLDELLTPASKSELLGMFDIYEVLDVVGHGGMGVVLKARDPVLGRIVAIKTLLPHLALSVRARGRFLREAKNTAAVNHPNIVTIHSVDVRNGIPYLVMEFVQGRSLEQELANGPIGEGEMLRISHQIAQALVAAHAQGLIHRDIKPANILLENGVPRVKVTDFGLSRAIDDTSITKSGTIAGTPQFMSPEQAEGRTADSKSDLFSLGSVMYTMCTGQLAFEGESSLAVMRQVCDSTPTSIRKLNPTIPVWVERVVDSLLRKDPDRRPAAKEVVQMLSGGMAETNVHRSNRKWWAIVAASILLGFMAWLILRPDSTILRTLSNEAARLSSNLAAESAETELDDLTFLVASSSETFSSLSQAIANAADGDLIQISGNGKHATREIEAGGKALTIEALEGYQPTIVATAQNSCILRTEGSLTLRGLTFRGNAVDERHGVQLGHSIIRCMGDKLVVDRCAVEGAIGISGIGANCQSVEIIHSYVACPNSSGLVLKSEKGTETHIVDSVLACRVGVSVLVEEGIRGPQLQISNSTIIGRVGCRLAVEQSLSPDVFRSMTQDSTYLSVRTKQSLFDVKYLLMTSPPRPVRVRQPTQTLTRTVSWQDETSFYSTTAVPAAIHRRRGTVEIFAPESAWSDWIRFFSIDENDCVRGTIRYPKDESIAPQKYGVLSTDPKMNVRVGADVTKAGPQ